MGGGWDIAGGTITASQIRANTITTSNIGSNQIYFDPNSTSTHYPQWVMKESVYSKEYPGKFETIETEVERLDRRVREICVAI